MKKKLLPVVAAVLLAFIAGILIQPYFPRRATQSMKRQVVTKHILKFDADVTGFSYSEKDVVELKKIDDRTYSLESKSPGMVSIAFHLDGDCERPNHLHAKFLVSVSTEKGITVRKTKFGAGGKI